MNGASPQLEDGYTRLANELIEALMRTNLSAYQGRILWAIWRETYGFQKKQDWIANSQLVEMTGIHKAHVSRTCRELVDRNIVTKSGNKIGFNKDYTQWRELPKRVTVTSSGNKVTSIGNKVTSTGVYKRKKYNKERILSDLHLLLFERFYTSYPIHQGKEPAKKAFKKLNHKNGTFEQILVALENQKTYKDHLKKSGAFCPEWPLPATWLNDHRWEDEIPDEVRANSTSPIEAYKKREGLL